MGGVRVTEWLPPDERGDGPAEVEIHVDPASGGPEDGRTRTRVAPAEVRSAWLVADPVVERIDLDERCWVDVVRGLLARADEVHDELAAIGRVGAGSGVPLRALDRRAAAGGRGRPATAATPPWSTSQDWISRRYQVSLRRGGAGPLPQRARQRRLAPRPRAQVARRHRHRRAHPGRPATVDGAAADRRAGPEDDDLADAIDLAPASGDLLVMGGACQRAWLHAVPKMRGPAPQPHLRAVALDVAARPRPTATPPTTPRRFYYPGRGQATWSAGCTPRSATRSWSESISARTCAGVSSSEAAGHQQRRGEQSGSELHHHQLEGPIPGGAQVGSLRHEVGDQALQRSGTGPGSGSGRSGRAASRASSCTT